ncbi:MAG: hypothetical protein ABRQ25_14800 [Clostridiaceae bacterium]
MKEHKNRKKVNLVEFGSEKYLKKLRYISALHSSNYSKGIKPFPGKCPCCGEPRILGEICPNCGNKYLD